MWVNIVMQSVQICTGHKVRIGEICVRWSVNQTFPTIKPLLASLTQNTVTFFTLITSHNDVNLLCEHHRAIWLIHYDLCLMLVCLQISTLFWLPWEMKLQLTTDDFDRSTTLRAIYIVCRAMKKQHLKTVNTFANALDKVSPVSL